MTKKILNYEQSEEFLKNIFLRCPECLGRAVIYHVPKVLTHVLLKCKCSKWRLDFTIKEQ